MEKPKEILLVKFLIDVLKETEEISKNILGRNPWGISETTQERIPGEISEEIPVWNSVGISGGITARILWEIPEVIFGGFREGIYQFLKESIKEYMKKPLEEFQNEFLKVSLEIESQKELQEKVLKEYLNHFLRKFLENILHESLQEFQKKISEKHQKSMEQFLTKFWKKISSNPSTMFFHAAILKTVHGRFKKRDLGGSFWRKL